MEKVFPTSRAAFRRARQKKPLPRKIPLLETLEDRMLPSTVTSTNVNDDGSNSTLRAAVQQADQSGGSVTIKLVSGKTYHLNNNAQPQGDLPVETLGQTAVNLTITTTGSGLATIDADFTSRLFEVFGNTGYGGATLNLVNVDLNRGEATGQPGGGVLVDFGGTLNLQKSTISNCIDQGESGYGGTAEGGGIFNDGTVSLQNSKIMNNQAIGASSTSSGAYGGNAFGGGVYNEGSLTILNGTFAGNLAEGGSASYGGGSLQGGNAFGGGLYDRGQSLSITGTTFKQNQAIAGAGILSGGEGTATGGSAYGGAAYLAGGEGQETLTNVTVQNNRATGGSGTTGSGGNGGEAQGGGLYTSANVLIQNSQISSNTATGASSPSAGNAYGGGIFNAGTLEIENTTLAGNTAVGGAAFGSFGDTSGGGGFGGAIASLETIVPQIPRGDVSLLVTGSTFSKNVALGGAATQTGPEGGATGGTGDGGALYWTAGGEGFLVNNTFAFNTAMGGHATANSGGSGLGGGAEGGAIFFADSGYGGDIELGYDTVAYNHAVAGTGTSGNGTAEGGGIASFSESSLALENVLVAKNTAGSQDPDVVGSFDSLGHNLIGDITGSSGFSTSNGDIIGGGAEGAPVNPGLATQLQNNGGPTQTLALLPGSIAIDHGDNSFDGPDSTVDQRGISRPQPVGGIVDIGAYEFVKKHVSLSEFYRVHWNPTASDHNFITGNLVTPLINAGILSGGSKGTITVSVPDAPPGFVFQPDGSFTYTPPVGFFAVVPPLNFQFSVSVDGQDLGFQFNVFITVYRGERLSQQM